MPIREQPAPTCTGDCVSFMALLPVTGTDDPPAIAEEVRNWVRKTKTEMMRDFTVLDACGEDASYAVSLVLEGPRSFSAHTALGSLGFRLDKATGPAAYGLPLISHWKADNPAAGFERTLQALIPRMLPLERCRELAGRFVECFTKGFNLGLDYSSGSLAALSRAFIQRESRGLSPVLYLPTTVIGAGCYLGEVLIREVAGSGWMDREDEIHCNFTLGDVPFNPWSRVLDLCVRGSEATLTDNLKDTLFARPGDAHKQAESGPWTVAWD